ncbi:MAG: MBL fold metallo-hydrolase [Piscinibacter sp.]
MHLKTFGARASGQRLERMRDSPRWAGEGFRNVHPVLPGLRDPAAPRPTISDFLCGGQRRVPQGPLPSLDPREGWLRPVGSGLRATWLGHSTVLIEIDGYRVLTDPVWGARASPSRLVGPKRFQPVPIPLRALPALDLVVDLPRPLRPPRPRHRARAGEDRRALRHLAGRRRAPGGLRRAGRAHHRTRLVGIAHACLAAS